MFTALKRLTSRSETNGVSSATPPGLHTMSSSLQKKFSKGVQYNMKIILKGDRNSGKTCLFRRLQGLPFIDTYTPTEEIQAANIQWNYKATDDVVKVEVWDVVDKAKKKKSLPNKLKIENSQGQAGEVEDIQEIGLDASFLDVYKGTNGVIIVFDITKAWTFDYVKREVTCVPSHIPILLLGNHRDMGHHRAIAGDTVHYFIESLERSKDAAEIRYAESSMRNGFGLKFVHKFFNLPFLQLQRETLHKQLETNQEEKNVTVRELDFYAESDDANYDLFIEGLSQKRRQVADAMAPPKVSLAEARAIAQQRAMKEGNVEAAQAMAGNPSIASTAVEAKSKSSSSLPSQTEKTLQESAASLAQSAPVGQPVLKNGQNSTGNSKTGANLNATEGKAAEKQGSRKNPASAGVDDFVPDSTAYDREFYSDERRENDLALEGSDEENVPEAANDGEEGNPMVAVYVEDVEPEVYSLPSVKKTEEVKKPTETGENSSPSKDSAKFCILSSSDEETEDPGDILENSKINMKPVLDFTNLDMGYFEKLETERSGSVDETRSPSASGASDKSSKKKSKKSSKSESGSSQKHHKKSKHKKASKNKDHADLEDFLNGPGGSSSRAPEDLDLNAYEAI